MDSPEPRYPPVRRYGHLFRVFFGVGLFTLGGGYAMIPLIFRELVTKRGWVSAEEFEEFLALASAIPGPIAPNLAFLCGNRVGGIPGALVAQAGCVLPSFLVILGIAYGLGPLFVRAPAQRFFAGAGAAVTGLVAASALRLARPLARTPRELLIAVSGVALILGLRIHPLLVLLWAVLAGLVLRKRP